MEQKMKILLVEDNEGDILLTTEALEDSGLNHDLSVARNGKEALDIVNHGIDDKAHLPDLILLDINLPFKNGHEVLKAIKTDEKVKHIPIIMLTTSSSVQDIREAYQNYASSYICKPSELDSLTRAINVFIEYWGNTVVMPRTA
ncbi:MAG: response regulator [Vicingaceae bacterium]